MSNLISYLQNKNSLEEFQQKCFVCVVDNVVVGNIISIQMNIENNLIPVILPDWQTFLRILQSQNHQFIERSIPIILGTTWNGEDFIANSEPEIVNSVDNGVYIQVNNSYIYHDRNIWQPIIDHTMYIISLIKNYLENNPLLEINIVLVMANKKTISFNNSNKIIYIYLNVEQTIIDDTAITLSNEPLSKIQFNNKEYTVNMEMFDDFKNNDIIIEYSKPNIKNIEISGLYSEFFPKIQYISPSLYKNVTTNQITKTVDTLTLFGDINMSPRRSQKLEEINTLLNNHRNKTSYFGEELKTLLENSKILINIHQSDYENTFEEIRCLPALQQKVLIVSEISPLTELVPFGSMIIWATYDNIVEKTKEVLDNYDIYYNQIFSHQNIFQLNNLHNQNITNLSNKLTEFISQTN